jgi:hypothetical protein
VGGGFVSPFPLVSWCVRCEQRPPTGRCLSHQHHSLGMPMVRCRRSQKGMSRCCRGITGVPELDRERRLRYCETRKAPRLTVDGRSWWAQHRSLTDSLAGQSPTTGPGHDWLPVADLNGERGDGRRGLTGTQ